MQERQMGLLLAMAPKTACCPPVFPPLFRKLPGCAHSGHKKGNTDQALPFLIMAGTERVLMKESWQAAFLRLPLARMTGRVSVYPPGSS